MRKFFSALVRRGRQPDSRPGEERVRQALDSYRAPYDPQDPFEAYAADFLTDLFQISRAEGMDPEALVEQAFNYLVTEPVGGSPRETDRREDDTQHVTYNGRKVFQGEEFEASGYTLTFVKYEGDDLYLYSRAVGEFTVPIRNEKES
ncbi:hypothetical protein [Streptomyces sp. SID14515]|uniref:hypothetical protein n=1 Tax=Streptomyces sp. SID14515 TaxID=2706074 RepID=UPI0013C8B5DB|nr:hypothetical protein [Streptomyces sp. SID14515]NEB42565.1 hypothetical protein [Streptomyces sp. SID14515]